MATRAGVGRSLHRQSWQAGTEAARKASEGLGGASTGLVLVFATAGHDQGEVLRGVRSVSGDAPLSGCSGEGVISAQGSDESSHAVVVLLVASDEIRFRTYSEPRLGADSADCGARLARRIAGAEVAPKLLLLFADGLCGNYRDLLAGLARDLPAGMAVVGGTAGDLLRFERTYQYDGAAVNSDSLSAVTMTGAFDLDICVSHGCELIGHEQTITRAEGGVVHEIDGEPAWSLFKSFLPEPNDGFDAFTAAYLVLAEHLSPSPAGAFCEFLVRVPLGRDEGGEGLYFAAGLTEGTVVQLALRDPDKVAERAAAAARELAARHDDQPLFVLQFDCAGRGRLLFGEKTSDRLVSPLRSAFAPAVPWVGLHTYGEIAPLDGDTHYHNYTGVLCAIYAAPSRGGDPGALA